MIRLAAFATLAALAAGSPTPAAEVVAGGPVHEGFVPSAAPAVVLRVPPPERLRECPARRKPASPAAVWLPGYWHATPAGFVWVSGCWRVPPPGRAWVPGAWVEARHRWHWSPGFWTPSGAETVGYLPTPAPFGGDRPAETPVGLEWVPARSVRTAAGFVDEGGYWDFPVPARGTVFAAVLPTPAERHDPRFVFEPAELVRPPEVRAGSGFAADRDGAGDADPSLAGVNSGRTVLAADATRAVAQALAREMLETAAIRARTEGRWLDRDLAPILPGNRPRELQLGKARTVELRPVPPATEKPGVPEKPSVSTPLAPPRPIEPPAPEPEPAPVPELPPPVLPLPRPVVEDVRDELPPVPVLPLLLPEPLTPTGFSPPPVS